MAALLQGVGWTIVARNWRSVGAEVDLIVQKEDRVRFVEVKVRRRAGPLSDEAVGPAQRRRITRAAECWLDSHPGIREACVTIAWVNLADDTVRWLDNAFDG